MDWIEAEKQAETTDEELLEQIEQDVRLAVAGVRTIEHWAKGLLEYFDPDEERAEDFSLDRSELEKIVHNARYAARILAGFSSAGEALLAPLGSFGKHTM